MSSAGANQESPGGTFKNVIDDPANKPQSHTHAEDQSKSNTQQVHTGANQESPGGTFKNVIDDPANKPQSHTHAEDPSKSNTQQGSNKCSSGGADHKSGESSCGSCKK